MSNVWFYEPFYDLDRFFDDLSHPRLSHRGGNQLQRAEGDGAVRSLKPRHVYHELIYAPIFDLHFFFRMDLHEDKDKNLVTATFEFPGVTRDDIEINLHDGRLTVSAETKQSSERDEGGYAIRERRFGKFARTLQLPQGVKVCYIVKTSS